jgi:hypothetical protein
MTWTRRVVLVLAILVVNLPIFIVPVISFLTVERPPAYAPVPSGNTPEQERARIREEEMRDREWLLWSIRSRKLMLSTGIVVTVFVADIMILWVLSRIGGPIKADVKASLKRFGGSVWIGSAGLLGAFLAIAFVGFGAVYIFARALGISFTAR